MLKRTRGEIFTKSLALSDLLPEDCMPSDFPEVDSMFTPREGKRAFEKSKQIHQGKIISEIIETEESFLKQLRLVNTLYRKTIEESDILPKSVIANQLFPGILGLIPLHEDLLKSLKEEVASVEEIHNAKIADIFLNFQEVMKVHSDYAPRHAKASEAIIETYENNIEFKKLIDSIEQEPLYGITGLNSLRQATVQRLPRYILLVNELIKKTEEESEEYKKLKKVSESYSILANRVNSFLKQSTDSAKVLALDRKINMGGRALLAPSMSLDKNAHRWKTRCTTNPSICAWCNTLITAGKREKYCARCNIVVHKKNCRALIHSQCSEGTLIEQGRKFILQFECLHCCIVVSSAREGSKSKNQTANLILFNDSLLIYYGSDDNPQMISLIRWFSRTKNKKIQILDSSVKSISITSPRDDKNHILTFSEESEKQKYMRSIKETSSKWLHDFTEIITNKSNLSTSGINKSIHSSLHSSMTDEESDLVYLDYKNQTDDDEGDDDDHSDDYQSSVKKSSSSRIKQLASSGTSSSSSHSRRSSNATGKDYSDLIFTSLSFC